MIPRPIVSLVLGLVLATSASPIVAAQDASPAASPVAADCAAPVLMPGTPVIAGLATPAATPGAAADATGAPADPELVQRVNETVESVVGCLNAGEHKLVIAWFTPEALEPLFGTADPDEAAAKLEGFPPVAISAVEEVRVQPDGRATADVAYTEGGEPRRARVSIVERNNVLLIDDIERQDEGTAGAATPAP